MGKAEEGQGISTGGGIYGNILEKERASERKCPHARGTNQEGFA